MRPPPDAARALSCALLVLAVGGCAVLEDQELDASYSKMVSAVGSFGPYHQCMGTLAYKRNMVISAAHCARYAQDFTYEYWDPVARQWETESIPIARDGGGNFVIIEHPAYSWWNVQLKDGSWTRASVGSCYSASGDYLGWIGKNTPPGSCTGNWANQRGIVHHDVAVLKLAEPAKVSPLRLASYSPHIGKELFRTENLGNGVTRSVRTTVELVKAGWFAYSDGSNGFADSGGGGVDDPCKLDSECFERAWMYRSLPSISDGEQVLHGVQSAGIEGAWGADTNIAAYNDWIRCVGDNSFDATQCEHHVPPAYP